MTKEVKTLEKNAQVTLTIGSAFIAIGAAFVSIGSNSIGWIAGVVMLIAGAVMVGISLSTVRKDTKK